MKMAFPRNIYSPAGISPRSSRYLRGGKILAVLWALLGWLVWHQEWRGDVEEHPFVPMTARVALGHDDGTWIKDEDVSQSSTLGTGEFVLREWRAPPAGSPPPASVDGYQHNFLQHAGHRRDYYLHWPSGRRPLQKKIPLVIFLHGGGVRAPFAVRETQLAPLADQEGFCVVFPETLTTDQMEYRTWNLGHCCGEAREDNIDDIGFIRTLLDHLKTQYPIDPQRIYIAGMSNGGMLAIRLGIALSSDIAAVASIHGAMFGDEPRPDHPVSIMMMQGTNDRFVPYAGGPADSAYHQHAMIGFFISAFDAFKFWGKSNRCQGPVAVLHQGALEKLSYQSCADHVETILYLVHGGFHSWSGEPQVDISPGSVWSAEPVPTSEILVKFFLGI
jgi:polyhydroxybutyrate depolymerase